MEPDVFVSTGGNDAQEAFQRWQTDNPGGFYINRKTSSHGMLHQVGCPHVGGPGDWDAGFGDVARRAKICHLDCDALVKWAEEKHVTLTRCADCQP
jgi:hypothetical protein